MNHLLNKQTQFINLGLIDYQKAWDYQTELFNKILAVKSENRNPSEQRTTTNEKLFTFLRASSCFYYREKWR